MTVAYVVHHWLERHYAASCDPMRLLLLSKHEITATSTVL